MPELPTCFLCRPIVYMLNGGIGGFKVSDAIGSGGANTLGRARGQCHFPYYFILGAGKLHLHNLLNFCKNIKESFNFTSCDQFLGIF
jgi:hypothetical protein